MEGIWSQASSVQCVQEQGKIVQRLGLGERIEERRKACECAAGPRVSVWMLWTRKCGWTMLRIAEREDEASEAAGHVRVASYHASQFTVTIEIFVFARLYTFIMLL